MVFLKEDGSLDIERINKLPIEEYMEVIGDLTKEQYEYYQSKTPLNESHEPVRAIVVDYGFNDERSGVDADVFLNNLREELKRKK